MRGTESVVFSGLFVFLCLLRKKAKAIRRAKLSCHSMGTGDSSPGPSGQVHFSLLDTEQSKQAELGKGGREVRGVQPGGTGPRSCHQPQTRMLYVL